MLRAKITKFNPAGPWFQKKPEPECFGAGRLSRRWKMYTHTSQPPIQIIFHVGLTKDDCDDDGVVEHLRQQCRWKAFRRARARNKIRKIKIIIVYHTANRLTETEMWKRSEGKAFLQNNRAATPHFWGLTGQATRRTLLRNGNHILPTFHFRRANKTDNSTHTAPCLTRGWLYVCCRWSWNFNFAFKGFQNKPTKVRTRLTRQKHSAGSAVGFGWHSPLFCTQFFVLSSSSF